MQLATIPIDQIQVLPGRRALGDYTELARSQRDLGPLHPVSVIRDGERYVLTAGNHRLNAHTLNGKTEIDAFILDPAELAARLVDADPDLPAAKKERLVIRLMEIDENLLHTPLIVMDADAQLAERQKIYETLYPGTKNGTAQAVGMHKTLGNNVTEIFSATSDRPTFVEDTASKIGVTARTVRSGVARAKKLDSQAKASLEGTAVADSKTDLTALVKLPAEQQRVVAAQIQQAEAQHAEDPEAARKAGKKVLLAALPAAERKASMTEALAGVGAEVNDKQADKVARVVDNELSNVHVSDPSYEWYTPKAIIAAARELMGGIDLDPASSEAAQEEIEAGCFFSQADDGLVQPWEGRVFLNPPYSGKLVEAFTTRLREAFDAGTVPQAVLLVNNCTDADWCQALMARFPACFTDGRLKFWSPGKADLAARQGQILFYLGPEVVRFTALFAPFGVVVGPR